MEVGHLRKGQRPFRIKKPKIGEDHSEVLREGADDLTVSAEDFDKADDLTLRAGEFNTLKACINVDHVGEHCGRPPLVDADWHAFCQAISEGIEGSEWKELYFHYRDMSKAAWGQKAE